MSNTTACNRCKLQLSPGAAHPSADACVAALRDELDAVLNCDACGNPLGDFCTACSLKKAAFSKAGGIAMNAWTKYQASRRENEPQ